MAENRLQESLFTAFVKHRKGQYNAQLDENIRSGGKDILKKHDPREKYRLNVHSIFWMMAAMAVFYYTDFYIAVRIDPRVRRFWLGIGASLIGINLMIGIYLIVWCTYIKKIRDWEKYNPYLIPMATFTFIAGFIISTYALWPVWGFLTPGINFTLFMGIIFLATLIPV